MTGELIMDEVNIKLEQGDIITEGDETNANSRNFGIFNGAVNPGELNILVSNNATSDPVWADKREVTIDYRGWLGLGVTPTDELHLEGNFRLNKSLKLNQIAQNTFAGVDTGNLPNITGSKNVAFGRGAMKGATASSQSTAVGFEALKHTNSNNNTAVGFESMKDNTTGSFNTAIGWKANQVATIGNSITSVGANAQGAGNPGNGSTAVGRDALATNTAANNTAVGRGTLTANTSGTNQVAIGVGALAIGTGAAFRYNTAVGANAGAGVKGQNNTLIGYNATPSATTANNEVTLGNSSVSVLRCAVTSITSLSDERDKTDIENLEYGLDFINSLEPRQFVWDNRPEYVTEIDEDGNEVVVEVTNENNGKKDFGFIAQEVQEVDNDVLRLVYEANPDKLEMSYGKLVPILVKAIQQLTAEVEALKN